MSNTCSLCNTTYVWPADLKRHLKTKHGQQKSKETRCSPTYRGIYAAAAAADRGIYVAAVAAVDLLLPVKHVLGKKEKKRLMRPLYRASHKPG